MNVFLKQKIRLVREKLTIFSYRKYVRNRYLFFFLKTYFVTRSINALMLSFGQLQNAAAVVVLCSMLAVVVVFVCVMCDVGLKCQSIRLMTQTLFSFPSICEKSRTLLQPAAV